MAESSSSTRETVPMRTFGGYRLLGDAGDPIAGRDDVLVGGDIDGRVHQAHLEVGGLPSPSNPSWRDTSSRPRPTSPGR